MKNKNIKSVTEQQITDWKKEYGKIYSTVIGDIEFIWRSLKRTEYVNLMSQPSSDNENLDYYKNQDEVTKLVVLHPSNIEEIIENNAGVSSIISGECFANSGFNIITQTKEL